MTLSPSIMRAELRKFFVPPVQPSDKPKARRQWANAYDTYAKLATDVSGDVVTSVNKPGFQSALIFSEKSGTPAQAAAEFEAAFIAYWTGATFAVGAVPLPSAPCPSIPPAPLWATEATSVVLSVAPGLANRLLPIFTNNSPNQSVSRVTKQIADAFHAATTTDVLVLITGLTLPPPPPGLPVTNTCTVF